MEPATDGGKAEPATPAVEVAKSAPAPERADEVELDDAEPDEESPMISAAEHKQRAKAKGDESLPISLREKKSLHEAKSASTSGLMRVSEGGSLPIARKKRYGRSKDKPERHSIQPQGFSSTIGGTWHRSGDKMSTQSWLDPLETKISSAQYTRDLDTLRPAFADKSRRTNMAELMDLFQADDPDFPRQGTVTGIDGDPLRELNEDSESSGDDDEVDDELAEDEAHTAKSTDAAVVKPVEEEANTLTWWDGVLARCIANILGVILFIRVGWVVGQAGVPQTILVMAISGSITFLTILSLCALCTNGQIRGGGAYYLTSRSLGPAVGGAVGILFSFGNMVGVSMYLVGFAETLVSSFGGENSGILFDDPTNDIRLWSNVLLIVEIVLAIVGLKYVAKVQLIFLVVMLLIICTFFIGALYQMDSVTESTYKEWVPAGRCNVGDDTDTGRMRILYGASGFTDNINKNIAGRYESFDGKSYDFFKILGIIFPAFTGIMAGANVSGDLVNPGSDIPKGTLIAWGFTTAVYVMTAIFMGAIASNCYLLNEYLVMAFASVHPWIMRVAIFLSTSMAGLTALSSAPRLLAAVAKDHLIPIFNPFEKLNGAGDPVNGYILSMAVVFGLNCVGDLNLIAPLITEFFIMTYGCVNAACFGLSISKSPGWRPSFSYYNKWAALAGAIECLVCMFLIDWAFALATMIIGLALYEYIHQTDPDVNWGSIADSRAYFAVYKALLQLRRTRQHIKNWRPAFLVFVRDPMKTPHTVLFTQTLTKAYGPIFYGTIRTGDCRTDMRKFRALYNGGYLPESSMPKAMKGFYECVIADSLKTGAQMLMQLTGTGRLRPNTVVIGYKHTWYDAFRAAKRKRMHAQTRKFGRLSSSKVKVDFTEKEKQMRAVISNYVNIIRDAFAMGFGVMILVQFRHVNFLLEHFVPPTQTIIEADKDSDEDSEDDDDGEDDMKDTIMEDKAMSTQSFGLKKKKGTEPVAIDMPDGSGPITEIQLTQLAEAKNMWNQEQALWVEGQGSVPIVDIWWLVDDGGLCVLIPHLMKLHRFWSHCRLRANVVGDDETMSTEYLAVDKLITSFRLNFEKPRHIPLERSQPSARTVRRFERMAQMKVHECTRKNTVLNWLRISELISDHSKYSGLVIVSIPNPRGISSMAYMALLHMLCRPKKMPPMMFLSGNGESALTFYYE